MAELILDVRVRPHSRKPGLYRDHRGNIVVAVREAPVKGRANRAVQELLSKQLGVPRSAIHLVHGRTSRAKRYRIEGLTRADLERIVAALAED